MSRFFDNSPSKKPKPITPRAGSGAASSDGFQTVGEIFPDLVCPVEECHPPKHLLVRYKTAGPLWFAQRTCGTTRRPANLQPTSLAGTAARAIRRSPASCARCPSNTSSPSAGRSEKTPTAGRQVSFFCLPIYFSSSAVTFSFVLTFRVCVIPCRCSRGK